jgi:hypothetical protein
MREAHTGDNQRSLPATLLVSEGTMRMEVASNDRQLKCGNLSFLHQS